jgi:hypothetical protein
MVFVVSGLLHRGRLGGVAASHTETNEREQLPILVLVHFAYAKTARFQIKMDITYRVKLLKQSEHLDTNENRGESVELPMLVVNLSEVITDSG